MTILQRSWQRACQGLGLRDQHEMLRDQLIGCYQEPQRHYHTLQHLAECLTLLNALPPNLPIQASSLAEIEMALWFHDAVYDVRGSDNEQQSADWAQKELLAAAADPIAIRSIHRLIMATKHQTQPLQPQQPSEQWLVDIDLAILGAEPSRFAQYDKQVRQEYAWVPEEVFRSKRAAVLQQFLGHPFIYCTPHFRATHEAQARENLQTAVANLLASAQ